MAARKNYVIEVMCRDRVGIVAGVTETISNLKGNIDAMSQTVLRSYFTIILTVSFAKPINPEKIINAIEATGNPGELAVSIMPWEQKSSYDIPEEECDIFVLSITGKDRRGVIVKISNFLSSRQINVIDLYAYVDKGSFVLTSQLMVPKSLDVGQLQIDLENLWKGDMVIHFQHENIFLACNRVDFPGGAI